MKDRNIIVKILRVLSLIILYYISSKTSMFIYLITLVLYDIYVSSFKHIKLKDTFKKIDNNHQKINLLKYMSLSILIITSIFILLSLLISESINIFLNINKTLLPLVVMSISVITKPILNLIIECLESLNKFKIANRVYYTYYIIEFILFIIFSIITIRLIKLPLYIIVALLYIPKIISFISIILIFCLILKNTHKEDKEEIKIEYAKEIKSTLKNNIQDSMISVCEKGFYYISITILYLVLSTRYSYDINAVEKDIVFIYLYGLNIINLVIEIVLKYIEEKNNNIMPQVIELFRRLMVNSIIIVITAPLICKLIFNQSSSSIYFAMLGFLAIFIALFKKTFKHVKNKKIIYISLLVGIFSKIILIVPLINSFYRMGYNLIYGDIISTAISMLISIIINYIYLQNKCKKEKILEKILTTLYENMILCILLIILQFIIPIKTENYILSLLILLVYIVISLLFFKVKKKRG